jgi:hypothetical protein
MQLVHLKQGDELILTAEVTVHAWIFSEVDKTFFDGFVLIKAGSIFTVKVDWEAFAIGKEVPLTLELPNTEYYKSQLDFYNGAEGCIVSNLTMEEFADLFEHFAHAPVLSSSKGDVL